MSIGEYITLKNGLIFTVNVWFYTQFCSTMMMMLSSSYYLLKAFNRYLEKCIEHPESIYVEQTVRQASRVLVRLSETFDAISAFYLINFIVYFMAFTFFNIFSCYAFYIYLQDQNEEIFLLLMASLWWTGYYGPCVFWLVIYSSKIHRESLRTADLVQSLTNTENALKETKSSNILALLVYHSSPKISCGFFEINWQSFFTMVCGIYSFAIISVQFYDVKKV